jgi:hypothetical protein
MNATLDGMGYRGDDASRSWEDPREQPWRPSPETPGGYDNQPGHDGQGGYTSQDYGSQGYGSQDGYGGGSGRHGSGAYRQQDGYGQPGNFGTPGGHPDNDWYGDGGGGRGGSGGFADTTAAPRPNLPLPSYLSEPGPGSRGGNSQGGGFQPGMSQPGMSQPGSRGRHSGGGAHRDGAHRDGAPAGAARGGAAGRDGTAGGYPRRAPLAIEAPDVSQTRQQQALGNGGYQSYPGYENVEDEQGGGYAAQPRYDGYNDYADYAPDYEVAPTTIGQAYEAPPPTTANPAYVEPAPTTGNPAAYERDEFGQGEFGRDEFGRDGYGQGGFGQGGYDGFGGEFGGTGPDTDDSPRGGQDDFGSGDDFGAVGRDGGDGRDDRSARGAASGGKGGRGGAPGKKGAKPKVRRPNRAKKIAVLIVSGISLAAVVAALYAIFIRPIPGNTDAANDPLPQGTSAASAAACNTAQLGQFCHIETSSGDPTPLTDTELFFPILTDSTTHVTFTRIADDSTKTCSSDLVGPALTKTDTNCSQLLRASYTAGSGSSEMMGTIAVLSYKTTTDAQAAAKTIGVNDFVAPLTTHSGVGENLGKSTASIGNIVKGHYLIVTLAELADGMSMAGAPSSTQMSQLSTFSTQLVTNTVNVPLSVRMICGKPGCTSQQAAAAAG